MCQYIVYCYIENQGKQSILCSWFFHNFFSMLTQLKVTGSSYKTCSVSLSLETLIPSKTEHYIKCQNLDSMLWLSNKQERYQSEFSAALRYISSNPWLITLRSSLHHVMEWGTKRNQPWVMVSDDEVYLCSNLSVGGKLNMYKIIKLFSNILWEIMFRQFCNLGMVH